MKFSRKLGGTVAHAVTVLLLLLIAFHALAPIPAPVERVTGSAFSSATADVSVLRGRVAETARRMAGITPAPFAHGLAHPAWRVRTFEAGLRSFGWPNALGPPARAIVSSSLAARAPPAA